MKTFDGGLWDYQEPEDSDTAVVIGIDQSYTGFGITTLTSKTPTMLYSTTVNKWGGSGVQRLDHIRTWLHEYFDDIEHLFTIEAIAMEDTVRSPHANTAQMLGELAGVVKMVIFDRFSGDLATPYRVTPTALKKYVTGTGNAAKSQMLQQVYKKWGIEFSDDNAADSFGIAHIISGRAELEYEKKIYKDLLKSKTAKDEVV